MYDNLIGYQNTELERRAYWNAMLKYKGSFELFKNHPEEWERNIAKRDQMKYNTHLSHYVGKDS